MNLPLETAHAVFEAQRYKTCGCCDQSGRNQGMRERCRVALVRSGGLVCHTNIGNAYSKGMLIADSLGKEVVNYALDGVCAHTFDYAMRLVVSTQDVFANLDDFTPSRRSITSKRKPAVMKEERTQMAAKQIDGFLLYEPGDRVHG